MLLWLPDPAEPTRGEFLRRIVLMSSRRVQRVGEASRIRSSYLALPDHQVEQLVDLTGSTLWFFAATRAL